jgi:hypothetical protein
LQVTLELRDFDDNVLAQRVVTVDDVPSDGSFADLAVTAFVPVASPFANQRVRIAFGFQGLARGRRARLAHGGGAA